jgi:hypothetical protein
MGLDPAALEHLKSQPMPAPQGKLASVKAQIRNAILLKSAAVMSAPTSTHKKA